MAEAEDFADVLTPAGMTRLFDLLADELLADVDFEAVRVAVGAQDPGDAVARALAEQAPEVAARVAKRLRRLGPLVTAAVVVSLAGIDVDDAADDVARVVALADRGVEARVARVLPRVAARIGKSVAGAVLAGAGPLEVEALVRKQVRDYLRVVAGAWLGHARSAAIAGAAAAAGVTEVRYEAVLDAATTEVCRLLHGTTFSVASLLDALETVADASEAKALEAYPWARREGDKLVVDRAQGQVVVATVVGQPGKGPLQFFDALGPDELERYGIVLPPMHANCRSTIVPVI